ncbi:MAG: DUF4097 family beta strand repeat-containing protein [Acidobacteria bacterium]|nr:DUF4097 family beta strand repeat-containing protein [Acidobacteriota bacterium]
MRRSSLIGPLLLILIGGLFLMNNLRPDLPLLEIMGRYWPFLLIAWGVLRLLEILYWAARRRPLPAAGVSGGEWTLIVLIALVGSGLFLTHRFVSRWPPGHFGVRGIEVFGESYDFPLSAQKAAGKTPRVVIENLRGNTRVVGADAEEVKVSGRKTIRAFQQNDANTANQQSPLEILAQGDRIVVRTNQERVSGEQRVSADLDITVPRGAFVEARGRFGDFDISEITGGVDVDSDNAGVRLNRIGGNARMDLRRSDIVRAVGVKGSLDIKSGHGQEVELENIEGQVTVSGAFSGDLQFRNLARPLRFESSQTELSVEKMPGQLRMALGQVTAENLVGPVRLKTKSRDVVISDLSQSLEIFVERGDLDIRPGKTPLAKMDLETRSGNIQMAIPQGAKFELSAVAKRGDVENEYGEPLRLAGERGRGKDSGATLAGAVGQGPALKLTTGRGTITIRKASGNEAGRPPAAPPVPPKPPAPPVRLPVDRQ